MNKVILTHSKIGESIEVSQEQAKRMIARNIGWELKKGQTLDDAINKSDSGNTAKATTKDGDCGCGKARTKTKIAQSSVTKKTTKSSNK